MEKVVLILVSLLAWLPVWGQDTLVFNSVNLHRADTVLVFSPAAKAGERAVPTLILLHGFGGDYASWNAHAGLQASCDSFVFRIVCPDGFRDSWYLNNADPDKMQWRTFFWEELWPMLESRYGLEAGCTFIDGLSMGGHGAMNLFLDHPDRFRGAGSMSGVLVLRYTGSSKQLIPSILGVASIEDPLCLAESAITRLERLTGGDLSVAGGDKLSVADDGKLIVVSCGTEDYLLRASEEFVARCQALGIPCSAFYTPGAHTWPYWVDVLPQHLSLFSAALEGND